jgi:3',5'-cyclic AMP phosphodiesterase CpdA
MRQFRPCGVLVNGDLAWSCGHKEDYERFLGIMHPLTEQAALVLALGNHDERGTLLGCFADHNGPAPRWLAAVVEQPPFRLVALDSSIDTYTVGGKIGCEQLAWLEELLVSEPRAPTVIFVHHPGQSSSAGCSDFDGLMQLAQRQNCIQAVVTAHDHEYRLDRIGGVHQICLPAVGFPFSDDTPTGWIEALLGSAEIELRLRGPGTPNVSRLPWK